LENSCRRMVMWRASCFRSDHIVALSSGYGWQFEKLCKYLNVRRLLFQTALAIWGRAIDIAGWLTDIDPLLAVWERQDV
jgi:hypothetical protein